MILSKVTGDYCTITAPEVFQSRFDKVLTLKFNPTQDGTNEVPICAFNSVSGDNGFFSIVEDPNNLGNFVFKIQARQNTAVLSSITTVPIIFGEDNIIRFVEDYNDSTKCVFQVNSLSHGSNARFYILNFNISILSFGHIILGTNNYTIPVGQSDIQFKEVSFTNDIVKDSYNFLQDVLVPAGFTYTSKNGKNDAVVTTTNITSVRADKDVNLTFKTVIYVMGFASLQENCVVNIDGTDYTTNENGEIE